MLDFVEEAGDAVPENTVAGSFWSCDVSNSLEEEGDLHDGLAHVGAVAPEDRGRQQVGCCKLFWGLTRRSPVMVLKTATDVLGKKLRPYALHSGGELCCGHLEFWCCSRIVPSQLCQ